MLVMIVCLLALEYSPTIQDDTLPAWQGAIFFSLALFHNIMESRSFRLLRLAIPSDTEGCTHQISTLMFRLPTISSLSSGCRDLRVWLYPSITIVVTNWSPVITNGPAGSAMHIFLTGKTYLLAWSNTIAAKKKALMKLKRSPYLQHTFGIRNKVCRRSWSCTNVYVPKRAPRK